MGCREALSSREAQVYRLGAVQKIVGSTALVSCPRIGGSHLQGSHDIASADRSS